MGSFIRGLSSILGENMGKYVIPYVDDLLIFSKESQEHLQLLRNISEKFQAAGVTIKLRKSRFAREQVNFMGHIISAEGVTMDPNRSIHSGISGSTKCKTFTRFLTLVKYHRRFCQNFASMTIPL